jgi:hypothetical protein
MHKKTLGIVGIAALLIIIAASAVLLVHRNDNHIAPAVSLAETRKRSPSPPAACLATKDNSALKVAAKDRDFITNNAVGQIIDVPAGTNVYVHLKTYNGDTATGTSMYSGTYGSYNFTIKNLNKNDGNTYVGGWRITKFETCKI